MNAIGQGTACTLLWLPFVAAEKTRSLVAAMVVIAEVSYLSMEN